MAEIFVVNGVCGGNTFFLPDVPTVLGRSPECHLQVGDPWISSMHALFERRGDQLWVVDLDSRNGTFVDEERVAEARLASGSRLRFGKTAAEVRGDTAPDAEPLASDQKTMIRYIADIVGEKSVDGTLMRRDPTPTSGARGPAGAGVVRRHLAAVNEVARALAYSPGLEDALARLLAVLATSTGAERGSVLLAADDGVVLPFVAHPPGKPPRVSSTVVQATLRSRAGILTMDAQLDDRFSGSASIVSQGIRSCISAPIWSDDRILGVLVLERGFAQPFDGDDLELATSIGFQAALAVERKRAAEGRAAPSVGAPAVAARVGFSPELRDGVAAVAVAVDGLDAVANAHSPVEAARRALALQRALAGIARQAGALVDACLDGGVIAVFGAEGTSPGVNEVVAAAVRCARDLASRAAAIEEQQPAPRLAVKAGVEIGWALAGHFGGRGDEELRASGAAVAAAQRLAAEARAGDVACGPAARARLG